MNSHRGMELVFKFSWPNSVASWSNGVPESSRFGEEHLITEGQGFRPKGREQYPQENIFPRHLWRQYLTLRLKRSKKGENGRGGTRTNALTDVNLQAKRDLCLPPLVGNFR